MSYFKLTETSPRIVQPTELNVELMEHQKAIVYGMNEMERRGYVIANNVKQFSNEPMNFRIGTTIGVLGDKVGSGKSYEVISLMLVSKTPPERSKIFGSNPYVILSIEDSEKRIETNLLIIPDHIIGQWLGYFENAPNIDVLVYDDETEYTIEELEDYNVVIVCSKYAKSFFESFKKKWARIFVDEADTIKLPTNTFLNTSFLWLVTGTPLGLITTRTYFGKVFGQFKSWILEYITVKCDINFVNASISLPHLKRNIIHCFAPRELGIIRNFIPHSVIDMINSGNIDLAVKTLNCNEETEENIIQVLTRNAKEQIQNYKAEMECEKKKICKGSSKIDQQKKLEQINKSIERYKNIVTNIIEKVKENNDDYCPICLDKFNNPVLVECCNNKFCFGCLIPFLEKHSDICPLCRGTIGKQHIHKISITKQTKQKEQIEEKIDAFERLIKQRKNKKVLVFSNYQETFEKIKSRLESNNVKFEILNPHSARRQIKDFADGKINVLLMNARYFGAGLNLEMTTDIIMYHRFNQHIEEQVIGRAQRIGRKEQLTVHYLLHDNENYEIK